MNGSKNSLLGRIEHFVWKAKCIWKLRKRQYQIQRAGSQEEMKQVLDEQIQDLYDEMAQSLEDELDVERGFFDEVERPPHDGGAHER